MMDVYELKDANGRTVRVIAVCDHEDAVSVESGGEIVAWLCPYPCDTQLPPGWKQ